MSLINSVSTGSVAMWQSTGTRLCEAVGRSVCSAVWFAGWIASLRAQRRGSIFLGLAHDNNK